MVRARLMMVVGTTAAAALAATGLVLDASSAGAAAGHPPGLVGRPITLGPVGTGLVNYDVAANAAGRAYIGWISNNNSTRAVHLCTLSVGSSSCAGGVQTISALGSSSAAGLRVLVTGNDVVKLVWFHDTSNSISGPQGAAIAVASATHGANLTGGHDVISDAPSFGSLLDAELGPNGQIWTVAYSGVPATTVQVHDGFGNNYDLVHVPYGVGYAQLAFTGGKAVMTVEKYGSISTPVRYAAKPATGVWSSFATVAKTWDPANADLVTTRHGLRLIATVNNASYRPVIAKWTGSGFTPRRLTVDNNSCGPSTHDAYADPSGRLLDVAWECSKVTITNYPDAYNAAIFRLDLGNRTPTFAPQIASGTRGLATVVYSVQASPTGNVLRVAHVRLPDSTRAVIGPRATGGRVTIVGPRSCLPPVNVHIGWTHRAATNWTFRSGRLRLGTTAISPPTLDGATLTPGKTYRLTGTATFGRGSNRSTARATLTFTTCSTG